MSDQVQTPWVSMYEFFDGEYSWETEADLHMVMGPDGIEQENGWVLAVRMMDERRKKWWVRLSTIRWYRKVDDS